MSRARLHLDEGERYERAGVVDEALAAYGAALAASDTAADEAEAHLRLGRVYRAKCAWDDAIREARDAVRVARAAGSDDLVAESMNVEVGVWELRGDFHHAKVLAHVALVYARNARVRGMLLQNLGAIAAQQGQFARADEYFSESVSEFSAAGYDRGMAIALNNASAAAREAGNAERALELSTHAADVAQRNDALDIVMLAVQNQAHALAVMGDREHAQCQIAIALGHFSATGNLLRYAECLEILGEVYALESGGDDAAVRCFRVAKALAEHVGDGSLSTRLEARLRGFESSPQERAAMPTPATFIPIVTARNSGSQRFPDLTA